MATYLGVSEAYIMGWPEAPDFATEQNDLTIVYEKLDEGRKARLMEYAKALLVTQKAENETREK